MVERSTQVVVDDTDPGIQYQGLWQVQGKYPEYFCTTHATCTPGSTFSFPFNGTSISVFGTLADRYQASSSYAIDGQDEELYNGPSVSKDTFRVLFYTRQDLDPGEHVLSGTFVNVTNSVPPTDIRVMCFWVDLLTYFTPLEPTLPSPIPSTSSITPTLTPIVSLSPSPNIPLVIGVSLLVSFVLQLCIVSGLLFWRKSRHVLLASVPEQPPLKASSYSFATARA